MAKRRVVITGTGVITALGDTRRDLHDALCEGRVGLKRAELFDDPSLSEPWAGEITSFDPKTYLGQRNFRPLDRTSQLLASATALALQDSGWSTETLQQATVGLVAGTTFCSVRTISEFDCRGLVEGPSRTSPLDFANTVINAAAGQTAIWHNLRGVNSTISSGSTSGLEAIAYASGLIREGHEQAIVAGGVEELCIQSLLGFQQAGLLCRANGSPTGPTPFLSTQDEFALAEGCAMLMLEELEAAQARGATILAEIKGYGSSFDPTRETQSRDQAIDRRAGAAARAIRLAIDSAELDASVIGAVSASASGHAFTDSCEAAGIEWVFNGTTRSLPVTATKSMLGECLGASAAIQTVDAVATLGDGRLPGIAGFDDRESRFSAASISPVCRQVNSKHCLINAISLDGNCCALVIGN